MVLSNVDTLRCKMKFASMAACLRVANIRAPRSQATSATDKNSERRRESLLVGNRVQCERAVWIVSVEMAGNLA